MRKFKSVGFIVGCVTFVFIAGSALATPVWRGDLGSTYQEWYFDTGENPATPESSDNPYATGSIEADIGGSGFGDTPTWNDGVWSGTAVKFTTTIPNTNVTDPLSYKDIVIEIGYRGEISLGYVKVGDVSYTRSNREEDTYLKNGEVWNVAIDYYHIEPNPTSEYICYGVSDLYGINSYDLDYVKIDTICIPEPISLCLLGVGGLLVRKRRKS